MTVLLNRLRAVHRQMAYRWHEAAIPPVLRPAVFWLASGTMPADAASVKAAAEKRRRQLAENTGDPVEIIYSPKPGECEGTRLLFSWRRVAETGKASHWGVFLYLCAREAGARHILELGSCAGISGSYLASAGGRLVTVEGASALAAVARETLRPFNAEVMNTMFDDALDALLPTSFDLVYIDGHHEKIATLRYFDRIRPHLSEGAVVLFDDISWSADMRDAWHQVVARNCFSHCVDLGEIGVCIIGSGNHYLDLRTITGRRRVGAPHGWTAKEGQLVE